MNAIRKGNRIQSLAPQTTRVWTRKRVVYPNANAKGHIDISKTLIYLPAQVLYQQFEETLLKQK